MRAPSNLPQPTRDLGPSGLDLWTSIQNDYVITDLGGIEVLMEACAALDRAELLAAQIAADGPTIAGPNGPRVHPCIAAEIQCRNSVVRSLAKLGLLHEPIRPMGPGPGRHGKKGWIPDDDQ